MEEDLVEIEEEDGEENGFKMKDIFQRGKRATLFAGTATVIFAFLKGIVGFFSGSIVLIADAVHSAADSLSTFLAWFGLKISQRKPTERFPYGFYKAETIVSLFISLLILFVGFDILKESIQKLFLSYQLNFPLLSIGVAFLDAFVMFVLGTYELKVGKEINSQSLIADGTESRMHLLSSSIVIGGLISKILNIPYIEALMGMIISLFVLRVGIFSLKNSIYSLLDVSPSKEIEEEIRKILNQIAGVSGVEGLKLRKSGPFIFGEVYIKIKKNINLERAQEISKEVEEKIKRRIKEIDSFIVIPLPWQTTEEKICIPVEEKKDLDSKISNHFGRSNYFLICEIRNNKIEKITVEENPFKEKEVRAGLAVSEWLKNKKIGAVIVREIGLISLHILRDNLIDVYQTKKERAKEALQDFIGKRLRPIKEPTKKKI